MESSAINPCLYVHQYMTKEARPYNWVKTAHSINGVGKIEQIHKKKKERKKTDHFLIPYTRISSRWIKALNKC